jgi:chitin synthase
MTIRQQKYLIIFLLIIVNTALSTLFLYFTDHWYAFLCVLALDSFVISSSSILLFLQRMFFKKENKNIRIDPKNYLYVVPCYNESEEELKNTLNSLTLQRTVSGDKRMLFIVCDGTVKGKHKKTKNDLILQNILDINKESHITTDLILKKILNVQDLGEVYEYKTWDGNINYIKIYKGTYKYLVESIDFVLCIKQNNYGKRDSLVLVRKLCYGYNISKEDDSQLSMDINYIFYEKYKKPIDYIIGIDADTIFDYNCSYELINGLESNPMNMGCVGYVDINTTRYKYSPWILYQYAEYAFAQCLKRYAQSNITHKVSCLSGCNQILRVVEETCGDKILDKFYYLPNENDNIFTHIRSYASEDRNHVCLMLSMYPYVRSVQTLDAICYTNVPMDWSVFLSQRRRWNLGANSNDMMLVHLPGINIFEKISSLINVVTFATAPFIFIATIYFIKTIITSPSMLMLYLSVIIIIPFLYALSIPIFIKKQSYTYYYLAWFTFFTMCSIVNLLTYFYSIIHIDVMKWGKTRSIEKEKNKNNNNTMIIINNKLDQQSYIDEEDIEKGKVEEEIEKKIEEYNEKGNEEDIEKIKVEQEIEEKIEEKIEEYNDEEDIEKGKIEEDNYEEGGFIQEQERETDV